MLLEMKRASGVGMHSGNNCVGTGRGTRCRFAPVLKTSHQVPAPVKAAEPQNFAKRTATVPQPGAYTWSDGPTRKVHHLSKPCTPLNPRIPNPTDSFPHFVILDSGLLFSWPMLFATWTRRLRAADVVADTVRDVRVVQGFRQTYPVQI